MSLEDRMKYAEMKTRHKKTLKPWYRKWWGLLILIISALLLILIVTSSFYVVDKVRKIRQGQDQNTQLNQRLAYEKAVLGVNPYYLGTNNSKITIVEFSDFACPFCQKSAEVIKNIVTENRNEIKFIFRDYPLHENSIDLALAARCSGEQNKFWPMHDKLFAEQDNLTVTDEELKTRLSALAQNLGLNIEQFNSCLDDKKYLNSIRADFEDGENLQIEGTPTWFINNYRITGHITEDQFEELIEGLLQQYGTN